MAGDADFQRLEAKVDKLTDAVMRLVLIEERQTTQGERIGAVEQRVSAAETLIESNDRLLHRWINRGVGAWGVALVVFALLQFGVKVAGK
jgi:hypothetical protein